MRYLETIVYSFIWGVLWCVSEDGRVKNKLTLKALDEREHDYFGVMVPATIELCYREICLLTF